MPVGPHHTAHLASHHCTVIIYFFSAHHMPGTQHCIYLALEGRQYYFPRFTGKENKAQRGQVTYCESHSKKQ